MGVSWTLILDGNPSALLLLEPKTIKSPFSRKIKV